MFVRVGANLSNFNKKINKVQKRIRGFGDSTKNVGETMSKTVTPAIGAVSGALAGLVIQSANTADQINTMSQNVGFSTKGFQEWNKVMGRFGFSMEEAQGDIAALSERAAEAADGTGENAELFDKLGVSVKDSNGELKGQEQLFNEVIAGLQGMENETERNAIATALLSTTGEELGSVLNMNQKELKEMKDTANVIDEQSIKDSVEFKDSLNELRNSVMNVVRDLGLELIPRLQEFIPVVQNKVVPAIETFVNKILDLVDGFLNLSPETQRMIGISVGLAAALGPVIFVIGKIITSVSTFISVVKALGVALRFLALNPVGVVILAVAALIAAVILIVRRWDEIKQKTIEIWNRIKEFLKNNWQLILAIITGPIGALVLLIVRNWDLIKQRTSQIWNSIKNFLGSLWESISTRTSEIVTGMIEGIKTGFQNLKTGLINLVTGIRDRLLNIWEGLKSGFQDIMNGMIGFVNNGINSLNEFGFSIPDKIGGIDVPFVGGSSIDLNIPNIPRLQEGGIITEPTIAMVGEGGPEAVVPLDEASMGLTINISELVVREEADIDRIAERLFQLQERKLRSRGVRL